MTTKRVTVFTHGVRRGPFARLSTTLARGFAQPGIDCEVVVLFASESEQAIYPDVKIISLNVNRAAFSLLPLICYLNKRKPDIIFSMPWYFNILAIAGRFLSGQKSKVIIGEHNICSLESQIEHKNSINTRFLPILMRLTYGYSDGLIGVCNDTIKDIVEFINVSPNLPTQVISNPVDIKCIQENAKLPTSHAWLNNSNILTVVTVARMAKQKQLDNLLMAFAKVVKAKASARLIILGDGPLRPILEKLVKELELESCVSMPGYDNNPYSCMSRADVFVLASGWEGCPVALLEALACGTAVIVNDAPGGSKDIVNNGEFGLVVPTGDTDALSAAILKLLVDVSLKEHYRKQALQRSKLFEYLDIAQQYIQFAESV